MGLYTRSEKDDRANSNISEDVLNVYKEAMAKKLYEIALSTDMIVKDPYIQNYIEKYAEDLLYTQKSKNAIIGIVHKIAMFVITTSSGEKLYPVIHEYNGHDLQKTIYFTKGTGTEKVRVGFIEVTKSKIIL